MNLLKKALLTMPRITIITATWNCVDTVASCIDSVANQSWPHREHVVIDGASTDGTIEILDANRGRFAVLSSQPDDGIYDALNKGLAVATGDVVGFLHADDLYAHSDVLTHIAAAFRDPSVCAVYGDLEYVKRHDTSSVVRRWKSYPATRRRLAWGWMPPHPTLYVRREWYDHIGGFDTQYRISADYLSVLKLFAHSEFHACYLPEVLITMRLGGASNRSLCAMARKSREDWNALRETRVGSIGGVGALLWKNLSKLGQFV